MVDPIPAGMSTLHTNISVTGSVEAIDFYSRAFGAEVVSTLEAGGQVMHSLLRLGNSTFTVAEAMPDFGSVAPDPEGPTHASFTINVVDVDAAYARAVAAGARSVLAPADQFHGDRTATLRCPYGHRWFLSQHIEDVSNEEVERRMLEWMASS
ncbi:PhnB protein [Sanguibacter gelidistatuariae]|uniref:PhnB protein n=1 Tax=Sanguibacter gelidistatuariae TaxID=1814289 RepID=A0A1G6S1K7_9MICO|nr:VOC family protein [Sanguibacter gelidistatuariae]SDD10718.1 PhnB protein [Sanguibacter gelidistatuariae]